ncbi:PilN domain-containing protein [Marinobacterium aestuariivivens]|uniref:PilN domain-containing protein n=1 Tax=Marinobacterium aestuariivivens TaxID=1698799 RepID=A0ABW1ZVL9_9GAMM
MIDATGSRIRRWQQELGDPLARFWRWWSGELYGLLPTGWRRRFSGQALVVRVEPQEEVELVVLDDTEEIYRLPLNVAPPPALIQQLRQMASQAGRTVLQLEPGAVLHKSIALPAVTEPRLASVLGFEMDRHTPFKAEDVYFGYRVTRREPAAQRILVDLYLLPRKRLDTLLQRLKTFGIVPTAVLPVEARTSAERHRLNLLPPELRSGNTQGRQRSMRNRLIIVALLLVMLVGFPLYQRSQRVEALEAALDQPRAEAQRAQQIRAEIEALVDGRQYLGRRKAEQLPVLFVLDELTQLLPDNTWLSRFELNGQSLRIQGESGSASSLIGILEESEMLMSVDFTSPVTINPRSRRERFSIEARLEEPASPYEEAAP